MLKFKKYIPYFLVICIMGLFALTRLWHLTTLPSGLHIDEASMAYDAWCLAEYGVDRNLDSFPIYLKNFGGGQSILYAYLCALLFRIFGYHEILIRIPAVVFSFLTLFYGMKISKKIYPNFTYLPLVTGVLVVICPYFIMAGRFGLDCNLMLGMSAVFLYYFECAISSGKRKDYIIAGITGGLVLYTYALSYIIVPIFLFLSLLYVIYHKRFVLKNWVVMAIPMGMLAFPLILVQLVNALDLPEFRLGIFTITKMDSYRAAEIGAFSWSNFILALSSIFVGDTLPYNSLPNSTPLFGITNVLFLLGSCSLVITLCTAIKKREHKPIAFVVLWFVSVVFFESHITSNVNKINSVFLAVVLIAVEGLVVLGRSKKLLCKIGVGVLGTIYLVCFLLFGKYYYMGEYTKDYYPLPYFDITVTEAISDIEENPERRNRKTYMAESDIYFALSSRVSPYELMIFDPDSEYLSHYECGVLGEIEENANYIVRDIYVEYAQELREKGYTEIPYEGYSLFYLE